MPTDTKRSNLSTSRMEDDNEMYPARCSNRGLIDQNRITTDNASDNQIHIHRPHERMKSHNSGLSSIQIKKQVKREDVSSDCKMNGANMDPTPGGGGEGDLPRGVTDSGIV